MMRERFAQSWFGGFSAAVASLAIAIGLMLSVAVPAAAWSDEPSVDGTSSSVANEEHPADSADHITLQSNIPYMSPWSPSQSQRLDLYGLSSFGKQSDSDSPSARPVVVFIHGGAWIEGDQTMAARMPLVKTLLQGGYMVAAINYRLATEAPWPAQINDCKSAIRFLRANASKYGIDPDRIIVFGESAGGHLAMMMDVTNGTDDFVVSDDGNGMVSSDVQAVISDFGIADVDQWGKSSNDDAVGAAYAKNLLFGVPQGGQYTVEQTKQASPITYVNANAAPMLLVHGQNDQTVSYQQSVMMENALKQVGAKNVQSWYPIDGPHSSVEVFCANIVAEKKYLDFLSEALPVAKQDTSQTPSTGTVPVYRFYKANQNTHVFSLERNEQIVLGQDWSGWGNEGVAFRVFDSAGQTGASGSASASDVSDSVNSLPVYRLRNGDMSDYVYTSSTEESQSLVKAGWIQDGTFATPVKGNAAVHRLYSGGAGRHMLVVEGGAEYSALLHQGWTDEGIVFRAFTAD